MILVFDDSTSGAKITSKVLQKDGHTVDLEDTVRGRFMNPDNVFLSHYDLFPLVFVIDTLTSLEERSYDVVIVNVNMPDGVVESKDARLLDNIRDRSKNGRIKVIATSIDHSPRNQDELISAGYDGSISKPVSVRDFRELGLEKTTSSGFK